MLLLLLLFYFCLQTQALRGQLCTVTSKIQLTGKDRPGEASWVIRAHMTHILRGKSFLPHSFAISSLQQNTLHDIKIVPRSLLSEPLMVITDAFPIGGPSLSQQRCFKRTQLHGQRRKVPGDVWSSRKCLPLEICLGDYSWAGRRAEVSTIKRSGSKFREVPGCGMAKECLRLAGRPFASTFQEGAEIPVVWVWKLRDPNFLRFSQLNIKLDQFSFTSSCLAPGHQAISNILAPGCQLWLKYECPGQTRGKGTSPFGVAPKEM